MNKMKRSLKQVKLVDNITLNNMKLIKMFRITMLSLKYFYKSKNNRNQLRIKGFITNRGFCRQIFTGLRGLLWQSLLGQTSLLEYTLLAVAALLGQTLIWRKDLLGKTVVVQAGFLKLILLKQNDLLGQMLLGKYLIYHNLPQFLTSWSTQSFKNKHHQPIFKNKF